VELTPYTDYGADLVAEYNGERTVVQAKRYRQPVGLKAVQEVAGARAQYRGGRAIVVTSASFTPQAVKLAQSTGVELWDRGRLAHELAKVRRQDAAQV
jgi:restriction system protein